MTNLDFTIQANGMWESQVIPYTGQNMSVQYQLNKKVVMYIGMSLDGIHYVYDTFSTTNCIPPTTVSGGAPMSIKFKCSVNPSWAVYSV